MYSCMYSWLAKRRNGILQLTAPPKKFAHPLKIQSVNGLHVNGGGSFDREFTKSLIIRDFDDVLKNPFRDVHLFILHILLSKKMSENHHAWPVTEGPKLRCYPPSPPLNEGLALTNPVFCPTSSTYQKPLKLGQCLEIDNRRSLSKFGDVTWNVCKNADCSLWSK